MWTIVSPKIFIILIQSQDQFECRDGFCLHHRFLCDGDADCRSGEDEINCTESFNTNCPGHEFTCRDRHFCIKSKGDELKKEHYVLYLRSPPLTPQPCHRFSHWKNNWKIKHPHPSTLLEYHIYLPMNYSPIPIIASIHNFSRTRLQKNGRTW